METDEFVLSILSNTNNINSNMNTFIQEEELFSFLNMLHPSLTWFLNDCLLTKNSIYTFSCKVIENRLKLLSIYAYWKQLSNCLKLVLRTNLTFFSSKSSASVHSVSFLFMSLLVNIETVA